MKAIQGLTIFGFLVLAGPKGSGAESAAPARFDNEFGWEWQVPPSQAVWTQRAAEGELVMRLDELKDGQLLLTFAYPAAPHEGVVKFRPVGITGAGQRFEFRKDGATRFRSVVQEGHKLDLTAVAREQIEFIGIEKLTGEGLKNKIAPRASQELKGLGLNSLPFPEVGTPYEFEIASIDGKRITSKELLGKVVLVDFWARWCGPCMAKMGDLKDTYARFHPAGLEIVGINHDNSVEIARKVIADQQLPWRQAMAPSGKRERELWEWATGAVSLPRILIVDRNGILRGEIAPKDIDAETAKLVAE